MKYVFSVVWINCFFQDCDFNVIYSNCPDGDPRPDEFLLSKLVTADETEDAGPRLSAKWCLISIFLGMHLINSL